MRGQIMLSTVAALALASAACLAADRHAAAWGYAGDTGPDRWGGLDPGFAACGMGRMQSPIDLAAANETGSVVVTFDYRPAALTILHNGHTVQVDVGNGSSVVVAGVRYTLAQFHFHTPSEHVRNGRAHPLEVHFVHKSDSGALLVIGVLVEAGAANPALAPVVGHAPAHRAKARAVPGATVDARAILPGEPVFYRYQGSLTTPPCSEGVRWFVASRPVTASARQIAALATAMGANARPAQQLNGRLLLSPPR